MKKFFGLLAKKKRKQENSCNLVDAPPSQPSGDVALNNSHKYNNFDSDGCNVRIPGHEVLLHEKSTSKNKRNSREILQNALPGPRTLTALFDLERENDLQLEKNTSDPESSDSEFSQANGIVSLCDEGFSSAKEEKKREEKRVSRPNRKNMYVINITNSKHFHIGSQKIINTNERQTNRMSRTDIPSVSNYSAQFKTTLSKLTDCEEKLTQAHVTLIALHVNDGWRSFLKNLGLEETFLEVLEFRNDHDRALTVYDAVQNFLALFPNTSLGFICYVLIEMQQVAVIQKLEMEMNHI